MREKVLIEKSQPGYSLAVLVAEISFARSLQRLCRVHHSVFKIAQGLPKRGAAADLFFEPGKRACGGTVYLQELAQNLFQVKIVRQVLRPAAVALSMEFERKLVEREDVEIDQAQPVLASEQNFQPAAQRAGRNQNQERDKRILLFLPDDLFTKRVF